MRLFLLARLDAIALWAFFHVIRYWEWRTGRKAWVRVAEVAEAAPDKQGMVH